MSTPFVIPAGRMLRTADWLFEEEPVVKVLVDKQDSHDSRFFRDLDSERCASNDDEREWTDAELLLDPIDWYAKRLLAEVKLGDK